MSSPKAARRAAAPNAGTASLAALLSPARAEASRKNGARSRGPKTTEGKTRSAQNALKHGLRVQKYVVLPDEDGAAFQALEAALMEELAPEGALQTVCRTRTGRPEPSRSDRDRTARGRTQRIRARGLARHQ